MPSRTVQGIKKSGGARDQGRRRIYSLDPAPLAELDDWLARYRTFWTNRLEALGTEIRRRRTKSTG